jgi:hypothetical protein
MVLREESVNECETPAIGGAGNYRTVIGIQLSDLLFVDSLYRPDRYACYYQVECASTGDYGKPPISTP